MATMSRHTSKQKLQIRISKTLLEETLMSDSEPMADSFDDWRNYQEYLQKKAEDAYRKKQLQYEDSIVSTYVSGNLTSEEFDDLCWSM